jgi:hypothetical protein
VNRDLPVQNRLLGHWKKRRENDQVGLPTAGPPSRTLTRNNASIRLLGPRLSVPEPVKEAVPAAESTLPLVTVPETFISGSNPGNVLAPAIRQLKFPLAAPAASNSTPKPNCEKGVTPSTVPLPPPFALGDANA